MKDTLPQKLLSFAHVHNMFPPGASVLCALSGGADSVSLLAALLELRGALGLSAVAAAHFNHQLRGDDADADEAFVNDLCQRLGVPLTVERRDVAAEAQRRRQGIEETARALRYAFLERAAARMGCARIATGHTADDNVETELLCLIRGSGLAGLTGIPPVRESIVRPLLTCTRAEVESYLVDKGLFHVEDATNQDLSLARNRIRHLVIPELRALNPRLSDAVSGLTARLRRDEDYILSQAEKEMALAADTHGSVSYPAERLAVLPPALAARVCDFLYRRASLRCDTHLYMSHIEALLRLCAGTHPSASVSLPGLSARREYGKLIIEASSPPSSFKPRVILKAACRGRLWPPRMIALKPSRFLLYVARCKSAGYSEPYHFFTAPDTIQGDLTVRTRQTGDRLLLPGKPGGKTLKRLMIDAKIPARLRDVWPVITDDTGVVAVPGLGVSASHRAKPGTAAVEITVRDLAHIGQGSAVGKDGLSDRTIP